MSGREATGGFVYTLLRAVKGGASRTRRDEESPTALTYRRYLSAGLTEKQNKREVVSI